MSYHPVPRWSHFQTHAHPRPSPTASVDRSASFASSTFPAEDQPSRTEGGYSDGEELIDQEEDVDAEDDNDVNESMIDDQEPEDGSDDALSDTEFEDKMESQLGLWKPTEREFKASKDVLVGWDWNERTVKESDQSQALTERELVVVAQKTMRRALRSLDRDQWKYDDRPADDQTFAPPFPFHGQNGRSQDGSVNRLQV